MRKARLWLALAIAALLAACACVFFLPQDDEVEGYSRRYGQLMRAYFPSVKGLTLVQYVNLPDEPVAKSPLIAVLQESGWRITNSQSFVRELSSPDGQRKATFANISRPMLTYERPLRPLERVVYNVSCAFNAKP
jgi:hypothetical protein